MINPLPRLATIYQNDPRAQQRARITALLVGGNTPPPPAPQPLPASNPADFTTPKPDLAALETPDAPFMGSVATPPSLSGAAAVPNGGTSAPFNGNRQDVAKTVVSELRAQGLNDNAIAGVLYNINQESGFNPTLRHPDQPRFGGEAHYAHGLYQEGGDEWNNYAAHLNTTGGDWQDPVAQTRFLAGRLKGEIGNAQYGNVLAGLQNAKTKEEAARIFASGYLKPAAHYLNSRIYNINAGIPSINYYTGE